MTTDTSKLASVISQASGNPVTDTSALTTLASTLSSSTTALSSGSASKASLLMSIASASGLGSTVAQTAQTFIKDSTTVLSDSKLGSIIDTVKNGSKEADTKVTNLLGSSGAALNAPVSFTTKSIKDIVSGSQLEGDTNSTLEILSTDMTATQLSTIASRTGSSTITTGGGLSSALRSVATSVSSKISGAASSLFSAVSSVTRSVYSTVSGLVSSSTGATSSVISSLQSGLSSVTNTNKSILSSSIDRLPSSVASGLVNMPNSITSGIQTTVISQMASSAANIASKIPLVDDAVSLVTSLNSLSPTATSYPRITNSLGEAISGISQQTTANTSEVNSLYSLAQTLCPDVTPVNAADFSLLKDLYDALLSLLGGLGLSDLLSQLLNCDTYYDDRSTSVLQNTVKDSSIASGDSETYKIVMQAIGASGTADPEEDLRYLNGNMILSSWDSAAKVTAYEDAAANLGVGIGDLVSGNEYSPTIPSVNAEAVLVMSSSNTTVIDKYIGQDTRIFSSLLYDAFA